MRAKRRGAYEIGGAHLMLHFHSGARKERRPMLAWIVLLVASFLALAVAQGLVQR